MRTSIDLDDQLLVQVKTLATETGRTLRAIVEDALRETLARRATAPQRRRIELPTFGSGGLMPGVDLDDIKCDEELPRRYTSRSCGEEAGKALATWARPSSYHDGGVNIAFISGRVTYLRQDIDYNVYIALMTLNEKKSDSPNPAFQLEDKHYR